MSVNEMMPPRDKAEPGEVTLLLVALQFLTRIPVRPFADFGAGWLDRCAKYFPLVGGLVGAVSAAVLAAASMLWPPSVAAILAVLMGIVLTGAFHEDGFADTIDGLGGGQTREQRLHIMKDSRIGTYGVVAVLGDIALKAACLAGLPVHLAAIALVAAHAGGRLATVVAITTMHYTGELEAAKVKPLATSLSRGGLVLALACGIAPALLLPPAAAIAALLAGALAAALMARQANKLIGGYTGDVLGAIEQMFELGFLLAAAAMLAR